MSARTLESRLALHAFILDSSAYGSEACSCGWRRDGWDAPPHEDHVAAEVRAWLTTALADEGLREAVAACVHNEGWPVDGEWSLSPETCGTCARSRQTATAALTTIAEHLTGGAAGTDEGAQG